MVTRLKLTGQRSHRIEVSWHRRRYKGNFHGQGDIRPDLGNWLFLISTAAILVRLASPNFRAIDSLGLTYY
jgi:hypothetical protein